tara:strand:- start:1345 stop:1872 length:528 start_codon:yes stop_codon:yes gene_type:complete
MKPTYDPTITIMTTHEKNSNQSVAPLGRRLMAMLYDAFLLMAILMCTSAVYTVIAVTITGDFNQSATINTDDVLHDLRPIELGWPILPVLGLVYIGFFIYFWRNTGQTLGMLVWKIKVVSTSHEAISIPQGLTRIIIAFFSATACGMGYLVLLRKDTQQSWHDRASNTKVIRLNN